VLIVAAMSSRGREGRRVPLTEGSASWLFPALADPGDVAAVVGELHAADQLLGRLGDLLCLHSGEQRWGPVFNRLLYYRLGPTPQLPVTELISEGWSGDLSVTGRLWAPRAQAEGITAPPWKAEVLIEVACDADPSGCGWHLVDQWAGEPTEIPLRAARDMQVAAEWAVQLLTTQSVQSLRARDPRRGHPVASKRRD